MGFEQWRRRRQPKLMIIPMIDIIFFLLVFFMMNMLSMVNGYSINVKLPAAQSAVVNLQREVAIAIAADGTIYVDRVIVNLQGLQTILAQAKTQNNAVTVTLNSDENVAYGIVVKVIDIVKNAGITDLVIGVQKQNGA